MRRQHDGVPASHRDEQHEGQHRLRSGERQGLLAMHPPESGTFDRGILRHGVAHERRGQHRHDPRDGEERLVQRRQHIQPTKDRECEEAAPRGQRPAQHAQVLGQNANDFGRQCHRASSRADGECGMVGRERSRSVAAAPACMRRSSRLPVRCTRPSFRTTT